MKVWAVIRNEQPLECIEVPDPIATGTEVVLEVTRCGVCHSDLHFWHGVYNMGGGKVMRLADRGVTLPRAPGHEIAGTVVGLGPDASGASIGDRVVVYPWLGCGKCEHCRDEEDNLCSAQRSLGVVQDGGFANQVVAPHPRYLVKVGNVDPALAATFACSGITVYGAIRKVMPLRPDEPVVLIGAGGLGHAAIAMLGAFGHRTIISVDIDASKRAAAMAAGATATVDGSLPDAAAKVLEAAGGMVKAVIDFVNTSETAEVGLSILAKGGKLILVGVAGGDLTLSLAGMVFRAVTVQASNTGSVKDLRAVMALAQSGKLKPSAIVRIPKDQANEALLKLKNGEIVGRAVLIDT
jgi:alcohol dehydrogenase/propanol-preferring alcohol dehydrogenase